MAKTSKGGIIIPEPGEVLLEAGASGLLGDAAAAAVKDYLNIPLRHPTYKAFMGVDWGKDEMGGSYVKELKEKDPQEFKSLYQADWPPAEPEAKPHAWSSHSAAMTDEAEAAPLTKADVKDAIGLFGGSKSEPIGKPLIDVLFNDETPEVQAELKKLNESIFEHILSDPKKAKSAVDAINDFTRNKMKEDGYAKKLLPPIPISNNELEDLEKQAQMASKESAVDILFWYYRGTGLIYSVRRVADNFFYDFETRKFSVLPVTPRATLPKSEEIDPCGYIYATRLAGKFADGEYVVTIRDAKADDVVVGIMALFIKGGAQMETPEEGLEDTPIEEGLPLPEGIYRRRERRVRSIDVDE